MNDEGVEGDGIDVVTVAGQRTGAMEPSEKKLNDDMVAFMRKRSDTDAPRYTARLKTYLDIQHKRRRAEAARKRSEHTKREQDRKKTECDQMENAADNCDRQHETGEQMNRRRGDGVCPQGHHTGSMSRSRSGSHEPVDRCGCRKRRRRRSKRRKRRRSCRRRRRRRRSLKRRRRSCSRRRRRRSCRRRRRNRRRRR